MFLVCRIMNYSYTKRLPFASANVSPEHSEDLVTSAAPLVSDTVDTMNLNLDDEDQTDKDLEYFINYFKKERRAMDSVDKREAFRGMLRGIVDNYERTLYPNRGPSRQR